jgi:hypothetical protein
MTRVDSCDCTAEIRAVRHVEFSRIDGSPIFEEVLMHKSKFMEHQMVGALNQAEAGVAGQGRVLGVRGKSGYGLSAALALQRVGGLGI